MEDISVLIVEIKPSKDSNEISIKQLQLLSGYTTHNS